MMELNNLALNIAGEEVLSGISMKIDDGEIVGILGRGGSGKSVLMETLAGLHRRYSGEILIDRRPLLSFKRREFAQALTYHSDLPGNPDETVYEFLKLSRLPFKKPFNPFSEYDLQLVDEAMVTMELEGVREQMLGRLSGSALKRVMLAFCLARNTGHLLLDEPTSGLDLRSVSLLQKALSRYAIEGKNLVIIASNDINFVAQTSDKIAVMEDGGIAFQGGHDLIDTDMIKRFFGAEVFISRNIYNGRPGVHLFPEN
jgi:iron complex transport system ATP-binding protein